MPYNTILNDVPSYLMEKLCLTEIELAKLLNVDKSTISKQIKNSICIKKNLWFWRAAIGHTLTYFNGETTIPKYGKIDESANVYLLQIAIQCSFAELFLKNIDGLKPYSKCLKNSKNSIKKIIPSHKYWNQISAKIINLADRIQRSRAQLDRLYELLINAEKICSVEQEFKKHLTYDPNKKAELEKARKKFDTYLESINKNLDQCIKIFNDANFY